MNGEKEMTKREWQLGDLAQQKIRSAYSQLRHLPKVGIITEVVTAPGRDEYGSIRSRYKVMFGEETHEFGGADLHNLTQFEKDKQECTPATS